MQNLSSNHIQWLSSLKTQMCWERSTHKEGMKASYPGSYSLPCAFSIWCPQSCIFYTKTVILCIAFPQFLSLYYIIKTFRGRIRVAPQLRVRQSLKNKKQKRPTIPLILCWWMCRRDYTLLRKTVHWSFKGFFMSVCVWLCLMMCTCAGAVGGQKRVSDALELELQVIMSCWMTVSHPI